MTECRIYNTQGNLLATFDTNTMGQVITIGRSSKCTVSLKGLVDTTVSREHLVMERMLNKWTVTNKSRFGMFKSGMKYVTTELEEGDVIRFTKLFLCYGKTAQPAAYDITWNIEGEEGPQRAVLWPGLNSIGASNDNYITVRMPDVSRIHGYINVLSDRITYKSANPDNPSYLNGEEIIGNDPVQIKAGDVITMADTSVTLVDAYRMQTHSASAIAQAKMHQKSSVSRGGYILM
ncbi:MAG: FHA domain-containing protein, partial [Victivallales bacterium]|nr:FHA domain-containing protein [Victivallales bacterium]